MRTSRSRLYWILILSVLVLVLQNFGLLHKIAEFHNRPLPIGVSAWTLSHGRNLRPVPEMSRLHLQFQAGEPDPKDKDLDDGIDALIPETEATSLNLSSPIERHVYASISSKNSVVSNSSFGSNKTSVIRDALLEGNQILQQWYNYIQDLQTLYGKDAVSLVNDEDGLEDDEEDYEYATILINSLIFSLMDAFEENDLDSNRSNCRFVLVVIQSNRRVDVRALQSVLVTQDILSPDLACKVQLAPSNQVQALCGFAPGCVPPIFPPVVDECVALLPFITIVDESLLRTLPLEDITLHGGGGELYQSCRVAMDVLLQQPRTIVAAVAQSNDDNGSPSIDYGASSSIPAASNVVERAVTPVLLPFFAIAGPPDVSELQRFQYRDNTTESMVSFDDVEQQNRLFPQAQEEFVSFVGRVGSVRRMARTLSFCDLLPPNYIRCDDEETSNLEVFYPWRNPLTGSAMAVQLILGQTLLRITGSDEAIRQIHPGQLVLVQGRTNLQSVNSVRNWIKNQTLDIVVQSYQQLLTAPSLQQKSIIPQQKAMQRKPTLFRALPTIAASDDFGRRCLRWTDLYDLPWSEECNDDVSRNEKLSIVLFVNGDSKNNDNLHPVASPSNVVIVNDILTVKQFSNDLSQLLKVSGQSPTIGLVGIDCEWQPTFLLPDTRDPQPVLLLQVSLHPIKRVYLFDLQALLRPMMPASQSMDKTEKEVSVALGALFESKRLIKVGFHVVNDLRQLAASYPHISSLHFYNAVLEASTLGKKEIRQTQSGNAREATSSLSRLVMHYIGKPLNKNEQCSDWSKRPLSVPQIEYSALDAAVTPIMVEKMMTNLNIRFFGDKPYLGRWENDVSFKASISSLRFVFVQTFDPAVQRKLKAKRVVGDPLVVSQSWTTGDIPPKLPVLPETGSDGEYVDINGVLQIPSVSVSIRSVQLDEMIDSMVGNCVGTSKDICLSKFLHKQVLFSEGAQLEYPHRSGFVEFNDAVVLFVNMQCSQGNRFKSKSYPNEWHSKGQVLTWFLRENDWQHGETRLAKKLLSNSSSVKVMLFVRFGRSAEFICCGRCQVEECLEMSKINGDIGDDSLSENWALVKLHLLLLDWKKLQSSAIFQAMLNICPENEVPQDGSVFD
jgi:3'-5' exonuclease